MLELPPDLADGAAWYVISPVTMPDISDPEFPTFESGAWFWPLSIDGAPVMLVRCPDPVLGLPTLPYTAEQVIAAAGLAEKPWARIGGR